jgi:mRNA interferase RelE/StbE
MASYSLEISRTAEKQLRGLPREDQERVAAAMVVLGVEPFPARCRKLAGHTDVYRIRVGRYRVIYSVEQDRLIVIILKIGHRRTSTGSRS